MAMMSSSSTTLVCLHNDCNANPLNWNTPLKWPLLSTSNAASSSSGTLSKKCSGNPASSNASSNTDSCVRPSASIFSSSSSSASFLSQWVAPVLLSTATYSCTGSSVNTMPAACWEW